MSEYYIIQFKKKKNILRVDPPTFHVLIGLYHEYFSITVKIDIFSLQQCYRHNKFLNLASHDKEIVFLFLVNRKFH